MVYHAFRHPYTVGRRMLYMMTNREAGREYMNLQRPPAESDCFPLRQRLQAGTGL